MSVTDVCGRDAKTRASSQHDVDVRFNVMVRLVEVFFSPLEHCARIFAFD